MAVLIVTGIVLLAFGLWYRKVRPQKAILGTGVAAVGAIVLLVALLALTGLVRQ
jgi:multisubunit Na+/H+ antiporter MnhB subunit